MKVLVTGGTGFVGTHLVNTLLRRGHAVATLARTPERAHNRYNRGVEVVGGDVLEPGSLIRAAAGREAIVHLVGIIFETRRQSFDAMHRQAVENVIAAAKPAGVRRLLYMSAMGAAADAPSAYSRSKAAGESAVRQSGLDWTIIRPSLIFGPGDGFFSGLAPIVRGNPGFIPVIGSGQTRFMPVSVYDVARVFADSLDRPETIGRTYEVGGPQTFTLNELYREIALAVGKPRKPMIHFPLWWGRLLAHGFEWAHRRGVTDAPALTRDQLKSLSRDNVADVSETLQTFGGPWKDLRAGLRESLHGAMRHDPRLGIGSEAKLERVRVMRLK